MAENEGAMYKGNTMRELERLRKKSSSLSEGRLHWTKDAELLELEKEYNRLLKQKEALSKKVNETSLLNQLQYYVEQQAEGGFAPLGDLASEDNLFKAIGLLKNKQLLSTYNTYRLAGLAFVLLEKNQVRFCLDTFYKVLAERHSGLTLSRQYFEPYYLEIGIEDEKIKIVKHTIPFFIPLDEIHKKYENSADIKELFSAVSEYLKSFVSRRQQCLKMKQDNEDYSVENFYATAAYDFVKFTLKFSRDDLPDFEVKLNYNDLIDTLPKRVDLKCSDDDEQGILIHDLRANFLSLEMPEAVAELLN